MNEYVQKYNVYKSFFDRYNHMKRIIQLFLNLLYMETL